MTGGASGGLGLVVGCGAPPSLGGGGRGAGCRLIGLEGCRLKEGGGSSGVSWCLGMPCTLWAARRRCADLEKHRCRKAKLYLGLVMCARVVVHLGGAGCAG